MLMQSIQLQDEIPLPPLTIVAECGGVFLQSNWERSLCDNNRPSLHESWAQTEPAPLFSQRGLQKCIGNVSSVLRWLWWENLRDYS